MRASHVFPRGTIIGGQFELGELIAQGGMGAVYRAVQRGTGAVRAVKLMHPRLVKQAHSRKLFLGEAQVSAQIRSEHAVQVIAAGVDDPTGVPWLAMELLDGLDLGAYLSEQGPMSPAEVLVVVEQICHALGAAHDVGIVHRDLKPENVFLASAHRVGAPYVVKLLDFGVAKFTTQARLDNQVVGTPGYMAPEQASETDRVSPATDIWTLGLLVFRMLVGRSYWRSSIVSGASIAALWREILFDPIDLASERAAAFGLEHLIPHRFDEWFIRCVSRDPRARFDDARDAAAKLVEFLAPERLDTPVEIDQTFSLLRRRATTGSGLSTGPSYEVASGMGSADTVPLLGPNSGRRQSENAVVCFESRTGRVVVDAPVGMSILEIARNHDIAHARVCGGQARCTTCRVLVLSGQRNLSPRSERERAVAQHKQWPPEIRLACQARLLGPVSVRRLVLDTDDIALVKEEPESPSFAHKERACLLATSTRGLEDFVRTASAYDVVHVVNRVISQVRSVVEQNGGRVVRCTGADIVAVFGQAIDDGSGEHGARAEASGEGGAGSQALRAALRVRARVAVVNDHLVRHFGAKVRVTVGLDWSDIVIGDINSQPGHVFGEGVLVARRAAQLAYRRDARIVGTERFAALFDPPLHIGRRGEAEVNGEPIGLVEIRDFHKPDAVHLVQETFERVLERSDEFVGRFYERLFELDPAIETLFSRTDMSTQQTMLLKALESVLRGFDDMGSIRLPLRALAKRHVGYGVKIIHYKALGDALLWTLERFFEDEFTPEVYVAWMETYGKIARLMIEAHMQVTSGETEDSTGGSLGGAARRAWEAAHVDAEVRRAGGESLTEEITEILTPDPTRHDDVPG